MGVLAGCLAIMCRVACGLGRSSALVRHTPQPLSSFCTRCDARLRLPPRFRPRRLLAARRFPLSAW
eukprot:402164-Prymnesium_polylepis.1